MLFYAVCFASSALILGLESHLSPPCNAISGSAADCLDFTASLASVEQRLGVAGSSGSDVAPELNIMAQKISYTSTFEQYEMRSRPFKTSFDLPAEEHTVAALLSQSYEDADGQLFPLHDMANSMAFGGLALPKFAANNYLLSGKHVDASAAESSYFTQYPAVLPMATNHQSNGLQCPANMHMLAWHYSSPGAHVSARLFPIGSSAAYFESALFSGPNNGSGGVNLTDTPFSGYFNRYQRHGFPPAAGSQEGVDHELPPFAETVLGANEYIFVPNTYLTSFQCTGAETVRCALLALCFVDASNLNLFRDALFFSRNVAVLEATVHEAFTAAAFDPQMLKNPTDMLLRDYWEAEARDKVFAIDSAAGSGPAAAVSADSTKRERRRRGSADFKDWQDATKWKSLITSLTIPKPPAPRVLSVGRDRATLSWNSPFVPPQSDQTAFGFKIVACKLTLGVPKKEMFALAFSSAGPAVDSGCESSKVMRGVDADLVEQLDAALLRRTGEDSILFQSVLRNLQQDTLYQLRLIVCYDQWESPPSSYSTPFRTAPQSVPSAPLALATTGAISDPAIRLTSRTLAAAHGKRTVARLEFVWPTDDGGLPITGFHVYGRALPGPITKSAPGSAAGGEQQTDPEEEQQAWLRRAAAADVQWEWLGAFPGLNLEGQGVVELYNVPPLSTYQFKVGAYNKIGCSALSVASNVMHYDLEGQHVLHGWGHEHYFGSLTASYLADHAPLLSVTEAQSHHGIVAAQMATSNFTSVCSGSDDLLVIEASKEVMYSSCVHGHAPAADDVFEIWRSHWTSSLVSVHAKPALTDALVEHELPSGASVGSGGLRGKIVFSQRGAIPFVEKAQRVACAGGLALIVVDDGQCTRYDQRCLPGADKSSGEGFGAQDIQAHWEKISIPVFFVLQEHAILWAQDLLMFNSTIFEPSFSHHAYDEL